jgi:hypothetical protein
LAVGVWHEKLGYTEKVSWVWAPGVVAVVEIVVEGDWVILCCIGLCTIGCFWFIEVEQVLLCCIGLCVVGSDGGLSGGKGNGNPLYMEKKSLF